MIRVNCQCGEGYNFKDELEGNIVSCPKCGEELEVKSSDRYFSTFNRDRFYMNQKHFSLSEKYFIYDEDGTQLMMVQRAWKFWKSIFAGIVAFIGLMVFVAITGSITEALQNGFIDFLFGIACVLVLWAIYVPIAGKRNIFFYETVNNGQNIMNVEQTNLFQFPHAKFEVKDGDGKILAYLKKNHMFDFFRKRWYWHDESGEKIATIKEESLILAILRKFLGSLFGLLRMNFVFKTNDNVTFGEFNRKVSLTDKYVLDISNDPERLYNRKVCIAIGVLLDTGEKR